ncbi:MAG: NifB/NifX family molybdenum-iron cluster-binding protein [Fusobacteriota bacterium]
MKIAVGVNRKGMVSPHLGRTKTFFIFEKNEDKIKFIDKRISTENHTNHIIEDIKDCNMVISGKIGQGMIENLEKMGIKAIVETEVYNPKKAAEKSS